MDKHASQKRAQEVIKEKLEKERVGFWNFEFF